MKHVQPVLMALRRGYRLGLICICLLVTSLFVYAGLQALSQENVGSVGLQLTGGTGDGNANVQRANVVVRVGGGCTGTLITPRLVLTARHCITGNAGGFTVIVPGLGRQPVIEVGPFGASLIPFNSVASVVFGDPLLSYFTEDNYRGLTAMDPRTIPENMGNDIAIVFLDPRVPVVPVNSPVIIRRPSLASPVLGGRDENGGIYTPPAGAKFGIAGWSPTGAVGPDGRQTRQVALFDVLGIHHYPGRPQHTTGVADGQFWLRNLTDAQTWPGDSGSPVFIQHADGSRDVFGVLSGSSRKDDDVDDIDCGPGWGCAVYADVTRGALKEWLLAIVQDKSRSPEWRRFHNKQDVWYGEVDYTGPCQPALDRDCDGWFNETDYCPDAVNPDQIEGQPCGNLTCALGVCRTPPAPTNCRLLSAGCGRLFVRCDAPLPAAHTFSVLNLSNGERMKTDLIWSPAGDIHAEYFSSGNAQLQVCTSDRERHSCMCPIAEGGPSCSNIFSGTLGSTNCSGGGGGGGTPQCPRGQTFCRGSCKPIPCKELQ